MKIHTLPVGQLQTNCYILEKNDKTLIIDPGDDADFISDTIEKEKLKPLAMIVTHGHFDHLMAAWQLQKTYNISFYISQKDQFLIDRLRETAQYFLGDNVIALPPENITYFPSVNKIDKFNFQIIETPGHTPGSLSFYFEKEKTLFVGDLLFSEGGVGRTDFSYCSSLDLQKSIKKILSLPDVTTIFPGHGPQSTIQEEKTYHI